MTPAVAVAIPARNEAELLGVCLASLAAQRGVALPQVVVLLNNCSDGSVDLVRGWAAAGPLRIHAPSRTLPARRAFAGTARRLGMAHAARLVGPHGVLLTTDADSVLPPDWVAANLRAIAAVDAVAGRAVIDPVEAKQIPAALHEADARECAYAALLDEIASLLDPDPTDPWPRHDEHNGATIAVRVVAWHRASGVPAVPLGEDRAFFAALRRIDARIRHAPEVWVTVSGRLDGRARGGMADTMRRRMQAADLTLDGRLERARAAARRASLRRATREAWRGDVPLEGLPASLGLRAEQVASLFGSSFGTAWASIEACSPVLRPQAVPVLELEQETRTARRIRDRLLSVRRDDPADTQRAAPA